MNLQDLLVSYKQVYPEDTPQIEPQHNDNFLTERYNRLQQAVETKKQKIQQEPDFNWFYEASPLIKPSEVIHQAFKEVPLSKDKGGNASIAFNYFVKHGIPAASAAGIVGNLYHENLANPLQTVKDSHGTYAYGIAGFNSNGDLPNLKKWASENGIKDLPNFEQQLQYLTHVITSNRIPEMSKILLNPKTSSDQASFAWGRWFERFAGKGGKGYKNQNDPEHKKRAKTSKLLYYKFNGQGSN